MRWFLFSRTFIGRSDQLLTEETVGSGKYSPLVEDPDFANAQNSALWELHLMRQHFCPELVPHVRSLSQLKSVSNGEKLDQLLVYFDKVNSKHGDNESRQPPGKTKRATLKDDFVLLT